MTVTCDTSSTSGAVPAEPDNHSPDGPVTVGVSAPTFNNGGGACPTGIFLTTATTTTTGDWTIGLQYDPAGSSGTLTIPAGGVTTQISGLASCTVLVAPDAPAAITGPLLDGTADSLPTLDFSAGVEVPPLKRLEPLERSFGHEVTGRPADAAAALGPMKGASTT